MPFLLSILLFVTLLACSDSDSDAPDGDEAPPDGDTEAEPDVDGDEEADGDADGDTDGDEDDAEIAWLDVPYQPPEFDTPYVDVPYLQEFNHTTNEVEPGIGELIAVLIPPESFTDFDLPTQVTPRGVVKHDGDTLSFITIPEVDEALIDAAVGGGRLVLAGPSRLYSVDAAGTLTNVAFGRADFEILGLQDGANGVYVLTNLGVQKYVPDTGVTNVLSSVQAHCLAKMDDVLVVGTDTAVTAYSLGDERAEPTALWSLTAAEGLTALPVRALLPNVTLPAALDLVVVGENGVQAIGFTEDGGAVSAAFQSVPEFESGRVPLGGAVTAAKASDGGFIVATTGGAYRVMERGHGPEWRVYNSERWLPDENVRDLATDASLADGPVWFATPGGLATVTAVRMTLEEKLEDFVERVTSRHDRDGAVADSHLPVKGDLSSNIPWDSDNDGSWTSYWLLAECFRYKATGAADAKANFDRSLDAMLRLRDQTGTDHFVARSVIRKDGCQLDDCDGPDDGEWFESPDGEWWVKGDTSNDEVIAHAFMMGHAYDLCADDGQKERIRAHIGGIVGGLIDNGFQLLDIDGEVTTYGQYDPDYVNVSPSGKFGDGGTRSVGLLAELTLAHYMTGEERFQEAKRTLIEEHHYLDNAIGEADYPMRKTGGDADELSMEGWFVLLRYERDPEIRARLIEGWNHSFSFLSQQQAAWWDMVNMAVGGANADPTVAARWLRLAPVDMIRWNQHNSQRLDLIEPPERFRLDEAGRVRSDGFIIPYDERRCDRWNTHQFKVDGGMGGMIEMDGADVLAPYWMGRYYGFIVPEAAAR